MATLLGRETCGRYVEERWLLLREHKTKVNVGNVRRRGTEKCSGKLRSVSRIILLNERRGGLSPKERQRTINIKVG